MGSVDSNLNSLGFPLKVKLKENKNCTIFEYYN